MKMIAICQRCNGSGSIKSFGMITKICPTCMGTGKTKIKVKDLKKDYHSN